MLQYCFNILRGAIEDSQPFITAKDVMKNYNVMELIEEHSKNCF